MRKFKVTTASRIAGRYNDTIRTASEELERVLNELREQGHSIDFITVNSVNEYTVVSTTTEES